MKQSQNEVVSAVLSPRLDPTVVAVLKRLSILATSINRDSSAPATAMSRQADVSLLAAATEAANHLYGVRDTYFPSNLEDKLSKLRDESNSALELLDSIPPGNPFSIRWLWRASLTIPFVIFGLGCV